MSKANIGWLFYKEMYKNGNDDRHIESTMERLLTVNATDDSLGAKNSFTLKTIYPGLLIGSGYAHGLSSDYDAKIGFYFDHTTGLPLIQGSSVKGVLRSCFGLGFNGKTDKYKGEKEAFIKEVMKKDDLDVEALANEIFEGKDHKGESISMYRRDRFYEARIISVERKLLGDDYITPHGDNAFKTPIPLRFVKVSEGVTFEFSFDLHDSEGLATADEKEMLFLELLQMFGIGAKTNVGYGQLREPTKDEKAVTEKLKEISNESYVDKILKEYSNNTSNIIQAYEKKILHDIEENLEEFKDKLLKILSTDLEKTKNKFKPKVEKRIEKVKNFT